MLKFKIIFISMFLALYMYANLLSDTSFVVIIQEDGIRKCIRTKSLKKFIIKDVIAEMNQEKDSALVACYRHQIGVEYFKKRDYFKSIEWYKNTLKLREIYDKGMIWKSNLNLGLCNYYLRDYKSALTFLGKAYQINGEKPVTDSIKIFTLMAFCSLDLGDFGAAIKYAEQAIKVDAQGKDKKRALKAYSDVLLESKDNIRLDTLNLLKKYYTEILDDSLLNNDKETIANCLSNLGLANRKAGNLKVALEFYYQALDYYIERERKARLFFNISNVLYEQKEYNLSIQKLKHSLNLATQEHQTKYNYLYSNPYENLADNYTALQQFDTALLHYQKALINLTNNFRTENIFQNPYSKDTGLFVYSNPDMIQVLHLKAIAAFQYYQKNNKIEYLTLANQTYQTAFNFHDKLQKEISTENSRLFQAKNIVPYIENALKVIYELQQKEEDVGEAAFRFMEKNKATVLLQSMNEADALQFANLPDSLLNQERDLKIAITFHNKQLNEAIEYEDTTEIERLDKILFEEKQQYSQLITNLENNYLKYYQLKYQQNQTQLKDVQIQLEDNTALLEYFVGDSSIYTLLVLKDSSQLFKIKKPADWEEKINHFKEAFTLSNREDLLNKYNEKSFKKFVNNGNALYQYLLEEPLKELQQISQLKIIPDAELNYIPFDLVLTNAVDTSTVDYKNLPYLLKEKTISYAYSAALMLEQQAKDITEKDFAYGGYAAKYNNSTNSDLPKARELVKTMASFFSGKKYLNKTATKSNFINDSLNYKILHLAMHGELNDRYPLNSHLVFSKNTAKSEEEEYKLYASDLYLHQINADLTILNACETGTGELQKGEGVMSLSRAFTYAGCPSLMMSLWSIDEQPSAEILETFLKSIKKGNLKDVALRQAKLDYLNNTKTNLSHPYYWAGLVLTGNTEAMEFKYSLSEFWWVLGLFLILAGGYWASKIPLNKISHSKEISQ